MPVMASKCACGASESKPNVAVLIAGALSESESINRLVITFECCIVAFIVYICSSLYNIVTMFNAIINCQWHPRLCFPGLGGQSPLTQTQSA